MLVTYLIPFNIYLKIEKNKFDNLYENNNRNVNRSI